MAMSRKIYILPSNSTEKTFQYDNNLPPLPVPSLTDSLTRYLESVEPLVSPEEFKKTKEIVKKFHNGIGKELHHKLQTYAASEKNWLEKWWENYAYLINREPLLPGCNMVGPSLSSEVGWKFGPGRRNELAARCCYYLTSLWCLMRQERYRPLKIISHSSGDVKFFNMYQYRRLFNTCQIPKAGMDELVCHFKTESEGDCPSHVIVIHKGRLYRVDPFLESGDQITTFEWQTILDLITKDALDKEVRGSDVPCLTCDDRDTWAKNREYLINIDRRNADILHDIEASTFILCLDDDSPSLSEVCHKSVAGDLRCRWADKALSIVFFDNGASAGVGNHTAYDGIVSVTTMHFLHLSFAENRDNWQQSISVRPDVIRPKELEFILNDDFKKVVHESLILQEKNKNKYLMIRKGFGHFGKELIKKKHKLHPDAFVQMALQLAYYKLHDRPAPTYETANTRQFYNGRTETHRSCTKESVNWCLAMLKQTKTLEEKYELLRIACDKHVKLLKKAEQNEGCDRHLFGLQIIAYESNIPMPDIFTDLSYTKSGGNGNFILSTSLVGYTPIGGGVMPMCQEGYGCFYNITNSSIEITISVCRDSCETSAYKFFNIFSESLIEMDQLSEKSSEHVNNNVRNSKL